MVRLGQGKVRTIKGLGHGKIKARKGQDMVRLEHGNVRTGKVRTRKGQDKENLEHGRLRNGTVGYNEWLLLTWKNYRTRKAKDKKISGKGNEREELRIGTDLCIDSRSGSQTFDI